MAIVPRIRGAKRRRLIAQHRLYEFEKAFDRYRTGEATAEHVALRGRKLKAILKTRGTKSKRYNRKK